MKHRQTTKLHEIYQFGLMKSKRYINKGKLQHSFKNPWFRYYTIKDKLQGVNPKLAEIGVKDIRYDFESGKIGFIFGQFEDLDDFEIGFLFDEGKCFQFRN